MPENDTSAALQPQNDSTKRTARPLTKHGGVTRAPRLYHKKSRTGCQRCRARRVKCDEIHPTCGGCERHQLLCNYDRLPANAAIEAASRPPRSNDDLSIDQSSSNTDSLDYPESTTRRKLELRLLHHYVTRASQSFNLSTPGSAEAFQTNLWMSEVPRVAIGNDALLNITLALAALHRAKCDPHDSEAARAYPTYLNLALRDHSLDVAHLGKENADAACLTSSLMRVAAFAPLQERPLVPYAPPMQWLQMTRGAANVFKESWQFIQDDETSIALRAVNQAAYLKDPEVFFQERSRRDLLHLLNIHRGAQAGEPAWSPDVEEAYASTLSYIGTVQSLVEGGEERQTVHRILLLFPYIVRKAFIDLVEQRRPRALVILAHYFALLTRFKDVWFIGDAGAREVLAILTDLPAEWRDLMAWPLRMVTEQS